jgi:hypothetical protein
LHIGRTGTERAKTAVAKPFARAWPQWLRSRIDG